MYTKLRCTPLTPFAIETQHSRPSHENKKMGTTIICEMSQFAKTNWTWIYLQQIVRNMFIEFKNACFFQLTQIINLMLFEFQFTFRKNSSEQNILTFSNHLLYTITVFLYCDTNFIYTLCAIFQIETVFKQKLNQNYSYIIRKKANLNSLLLS